MTNKRYAKGLRLAICLILVSGPLGAPPEPADAVSYASAAPTIQLSPVGSDAPTLETPDTFQAGPDLDQPNPPAVPIPPVIRGLAGDLWADVVVGDPNFGSVGPHSTTGNHLFWSNGAIFDRAHNRLYVYDSGNNRIVSVNPANCPQENCTADIVIGQTNLTSSGCNRDSSFQGYPDRAPASAETLCLQPENILSVDEVGSGASMAIDNRPGPTQGDLYVADFFNNRVLRYSYPITTGEAAVDVWGQADFSGKECNRHPTPYPDPRSTTPGPNTLCFSWGVNEGSGNNNIVAGVDIDPLGNLWVVDNGNNRVLRFPAGSHDADLVLGQSSMTTRVSDCGAYPALNRMCNPSAVRMDPNMPYPGWLYVTDQRASQATPPGDRVLVFKPNQFIGDFVTGQAGELFTPYGTFNDPWGIDFDPTRPGIWVTNHGATRIERWLTDTIKLEQYIGPPSPGCNCVYFPSGSVGIDGSGNLFVTSSATGLRNAVQLIDPDGFSLVQTIFPSTYPRPGNSQTLSGLSTASGIAVVDGQMIVADDRRIIFWNGAPSFSDGQAANGVVAYQGPNPPGVTDQYLTLKASPNSLYVSIITTTNYIDIYARVDIYDLPLTPSSSPAKTLRFPFNTVGPGGGQPIYGFGVFWGLVPTDDDQFLWLANTNADRVFRIRSPLGADPRVDVVLGQVGIEPNRDTLCNGIPESVTWTNAVNVTPTGNTIQKTGGVNGQWDAGARSSQFIAAPYTPYSYGEGYAEITVYDNVYDRAFGLGQVDSSQHLNDIEFAFRLEPLGQLNIYESGQLVAGPFTYSEGNILRVELKDDGYVRYYKDNVLLRTSSGKLPDRAAPTFMDTSIATSGARIENAYFAGVRRANTLCRPGALSLDRRGNLYVSDHSLEVDGNLRLLEFNKELFPPDNQVVLLAPNASKIFADTATWETAFDKQNRMFVGYNLYFHPTPSGRFLGIYNDPLSSTSFTPNSYLSDYNSMAIAATFDEHDNLYVGDLNRSRVLIYRHPAYGQPVTWTGQTNVVTGGNTVTKTGGVDMAWDATAFSTLAIQSGDGYAQVTVDGNGTWRMFGLTSNNYTPHYQDIDYAVFMKADGGVTLYQKGGAFVADLQGVTLSTGDIIKLAIEGSQVKLYHNGNQVCPAPNCQFTWPLHYPLRFDTAIASIGGKVSNAYLGGTDLGAVTFQVPIWAQAQNVKILGNTVRKVGGAHMAWDATAVSTKKLLAGDGYAQMTVDDTTTWRMFGLTSNNYTPHYQDMDYAIFIKQGTPIDTSLTIYQKGGQFVADLDHVRVRKGDILKVAIEGGQPKVYHNSTVVCPAPGCQFTWPVHYPLMVDTTIASLSGHSYNPIWGGQIYNVFLNGTNVGP